MTGSRVFFIVFVVDAEVGKELIFDLAFGFMFGVVFYSIEMKCKIRVKKPEFKLKISSTMVIIIKLTKLFNVTYICLITFT